jgi:hypothetical protein
VYFYFHVCVSNTKLVCCCHSWLVEHIAKTGPYYVDE